MVKEKIAQFRDRIRTTHGVAVCAPAFRHGIISGNCPGSGLTGPRFRAVSGAVPSPAGPGAGIPGTGRLQPVTVQPDGCTVVTVGDVIPAAPIVCDPADPAGLPADVRAAVQERGVTR